MRVTGVGRDLRTEARVAEMFLAAERRFQDKGLLSILSG
jgi:hypothetical protein